VKARQTKPGDGADKESAGWRVALLLILALALLALASSPWDRQMSDALFRNAALQGDKSLRALLELFGTLGKGDVAFLAVLIAGSCGMRKKATAALIALLVCACLVWPLKVAVGRERPRERDAHSFPSGDTATSATVAFSLAGGSGAAGVAGGALTAVVGVYRVYCGAHYPSDVLAGAAVGVLSGALGTAFMRRRSRIPGFAVYLTGLITFLGLLALSRHAPGFAIPVRLGFASQDFLGGFWPYLLALVAVRHLILFRRSGYSFSRYRAML